MHFIRATQQEVNQTEVPVLDATTYVVDQLIVYFPERLLRNARASAQLRRSPQARDHRHAQQVIMSAARIGLDHL